MTALAPFQDIEEAICVHLAALVADLSHVDTVTPDDLQQQLPFIRVRRFGGSDDLFTDTARINVDYFAATRAAAFAGAEAVRQFLISEPFVAAGVCVDRVTTTSAPIEVPWDDPNVRRYTAAYTASARR